MLLEEAKRLFALILLVPGAVAELDEHLVTADLFARPSHPYTIGLIRSIPSVDRRARLVPIPGTPPDLAGLGPGCPFAPRCAERQPRCETEYPLPVTLGEGHVAHCWVARGAEVAPA